MDITYDILQVMRLTRNNITQYCGMVMLSQRLLCDIHGFMITIYDLCPNLMRVQTAKVPYGHKELAYQKNNFTRV